MPLNKETSSPYQGDKDKDNASYRRDEGFISKMFLIQVIIRSSLKFGYSHLSFLDLSSFAVIDHFNAQ